MCVKVLIAMCHGLTDKEGSPLLNIDTPPWNVKNSRRDIRPNNNHYMAEVIRRWKHLKRLRQLNKKDSGTAPRPGGWKLIKLHEWLCDHPILADADNDFLTKVVSIRKSGFQKSADETDQGNAKLAAGNWVGKYPFLRMLHAIIDNEEIKAMFLRRAELPSGRMAVENRLHIVLVWTRIAEVWNDTTFEPLTEALPHEHTDFSESEIITHDLVGHMSVATAEKVELKWNEIKNALTRIIGNWERSGQGEGGLVYAEQSDGMYGCSRTKILISSIFGFSWKNTNSLRRRFKN